MSTSIKLYALSLYSSLYINYTSIMLFLKTVDGITYLPQKVDLRNLCKAIQCMIHEQSGSYFFGSKDLALFTQIIAGF